MVKRGKTVFSSELSRREALCVLLYLPVHVFILPAVLGALASRGLFGEAAANLIM